MTTYTGVPIPAQPGWWPPPACGCCTCPALPPSACLAAAVQESDRAGLLPRGDQEVPDSAGGGLPDSHREEVQVSAQGEVSHCGQGGVHCQAQHKVRLSTRQHCQHFPPPRHSSVCTTVPTQHCVTVPSQDCSITYQEQCLDRKTKECRMVKQADCGTGRDKFRGNIKTFKCIY